MLTKREEQVLFLKAHGQHEAALATVLKSYFQGQARRLADAVGKFEDPNPGIVPHIFDVQAEHERLMKLIQNPLMVTMARGAAETLKRAKRRGSKAADYFGEMPELGFDLPSLVLQSIRRAFVDLTAQPYWRQIQQTSSHLLTDILQSGVESGANAARIARRLREEMGGQTAAKRALLISRTETTGSLNAGHQAAGEDLQRDGFAVRKEWSTTMDSDARADHVALNGVSVANGTDFNVGGSPAPYPGHYSLPVSQRANCRCGCITRSVD